MRAGSGTHHLTTDPTTFRRTSSIFGDTGALFPLLLIPLPKHYELEIPLCRHVPGQHGKPKEHQQLLAKNKLYLPHFSLSFLPRMGLLLLNNKPSCEIPVGGISFQLYHVSAPTAPRGLSLPPCARSPSKFCVWLQQNADLFLFNFFNPCLQVGYSATLRH